MINIEDLTMKQIKQIQSMLTAPASDSRHPYQVGQNYFIRTVTHYYTGKIERITSKEIVMSTVAWIADTGRFSDALKTGNLSEVEPIPGEVIIGRGAVIDAIRWNFDLPTSQK